MNHGCDKCSYAGRSAEDWYVTAQCEAQLAEERANTIKALTEERDWLAARAQAADERCDLHFKTIDRVVEERDKAQIAGWQMEVERDAAKKNFEHLRETTKNASRTFQSVVDRAEKAERDYERIANDLASVDKERCAALARVTRLTAEVEAMRAMQDIANATMERLTEQLHAAEKACDEARGLLRETRVWVEAKSLSARIAEHLGVTNE